MKKIIRNTVVFCSLCASLAAQTGDDPPCSINEGTMLGIGRYNIMNQYLSPGNDVNYTGTGFRILNERMKLVHPRLSSQQMLHVDLSYTHNAAGSIGALSGMIDYSYGYHYRFMPAEGLKMLTGASLRGMLGLIYNTQSGNNPSALNADIDLNLSVAAIYTFRLRDFPMTFRYQADVPVMGMFFAPEKGQSYYEIFGLKNAEHVVHFSSPFNKQAVRNYLTVDIPVWICTVRTGYMNSLYYTDVNEIKTHHVSHSFMIGLAKELIFFQGKALKKNHLYRSAYY